MALSKKALRPLIVILAVAALMVFLWVLLSNREDSPDYIGATGVVEATEVNISPKIAGRVEWLCCAEGAAVKTGQKAATLDDAELEAGVEEGKAELKGAVESVNEARVSLENAVARSEAARYEKEAAEAEVERYASLLKEAGDNLDRARGLIKDGYITRKDMDSAETAYSAASASLDSARARQKSSEANLKNSLAGIKAAKAGIFLALAAKEQAAARLKVLDSRLADTVMVSPIDGVVVYKAYETGEFVTPGSVIYTVDDMANVWVRFDLEETEIQRIRLGDRVEAAPIGSPGKVFEGRVTEISEAGGFATQRDVTRGRSDIRTFSIKARIAKPEGYLKPRMTVEVKVFFGTAPR
jgi:HlyD family secretion protein